MPRFPLSKTLPQTKSVESLSKPLLPTSDTRPSSLAQDSAATSESTKTAATTTIKTADGDSQTDPLAAANAYFRGRAVEHAMSRF
ncbi:hypothetical protein BGZ94_004559 [Podila epigama]|nr:hypothetical protein BGZ94_004559 [Podila epigama]